MIVAESLLQIKTKTQLLLCLGDAPEKYAADDTKLKLNCAFHKQCISKEKGATHDTIAQICNHSHAIFECNKFKFINGVIATFTINTL